MLILPAHAKINLGLDVLARRDDGWHDIDSIIVPIDWHDLVGVRLVSGGHGMSMLITGPAADGVPAGGDNVAARAAELLLAAAGVTATLSIWIDKQVPHGAGLGGGSADAGAALRAIALLLARDGTPAADRVVSTVAATVGSDVIAALANRPVRAGGRGERVSHVSAPGLDVVIVFVAPSATAAAYAALAVGDMSRGDRIGRLAASLQAGRRPADELLGSALEAAACRANPGLADELGRARQVVPEQRWHLTGSGGALFSIAGNRAHAEALAVRMRAAGYLARAARTRAAL